MKKKCGLLLCLCLLLLTCKPGIEEEYDSAVVTFTSGKIYIKQNNDWEELKTGDRVYADDTIKTEEASFCDLQFGELSFIRIESNTLISLKNLFIKPGEADIEIKLNEGTVLCQVEGLNENERYSINTGYAFLSVKGTSFMVHYSETSQTELSVKDGKVMVLPTTMDIGEIKRGFGEEEKGVLDLIGKIEGSGILIESGQEITIDKEDVLKTEVSSNELLDKLEQLKTGEVDEAVLDELNRTVERYIDDIHTCGLSPREISNENRNKLEEMAELTIQVSPESDVQVTLDKETEEKEPEEMEVSKEEKEQGIEKEPDVTEEKGTEEKILETVIEEKTTAGVVLQQKNIALQETGIYDTATVNMTGGTGSILWQKSFGGNGLDIANDVVVTADGGYTVVGETSTYGMGQTDILVFKLDSQGNLLWSKTFGGYSLDSGRSIIQTPDGAYIIAGYTYSAGAGKNDAVIIKTDSLGNQLWSKTYGYSLNDIAYAVKPVQGGGYIVVGESFSHSVNSNDCWVFKLDANGNMEWEKYFGGKDTSEIAKAIIQTPDGGFIVAAFNFWIIGLDSSGNTRWEKHLGGDEVNCIEAATNGFILAGSEEEGMGFNMRVLNLDSQGNKLWEKSLGGDDWEVAYSVCPVSKGGYVVSGYTCSNANGISDMWIVWLDANGGLLSDLKLGGEHMETANAIYETRDSALIIAGGINKMEPETEGNNDIWMIKLKQ